jgi:hypothetical protein
MKNDCLICGNENPKHGMKTCCRKCADELKKINSREKRKCLMCEIEFEIRKKDERQLCSEECRKKWQQMPENIEKRINSSKIAIKEKFGVDNVFQLKNIKEKLKETKKEKYGDENYNNKDKMIITKKEKYGEGYLKKSIEKIKENLMDKYGVDHPLKIQKFLDKKTKTTFNKYGVENISQLQKTKDKVKETTKKHFGVENASQSKEIKEKKKQTSINNFGVSHHLKDYDMLQKHFKAQYKIKKYKDTNLYYQGTYELYFLEKMEEKGKLSEIQNGKSYNYIYDGEEHVYHTDFFYNNSNIEIKSGWTYNKNGKDKKLEEINNVKWKSVRDFGDKINIMLSKQQIDLFVNGIY